MGVGPATPAQKNTPATQTETRDKTAPGGRSEADQETGFTMNGE